MTRQSCPNCSHIRVCEHFKNHSANAFTCGEFSNRHLTFTVPWPVGTTLYRVDKKRVPCKHGEIRYDSYSCPCYHNCYLDHFTCQCSVDYKVFTMENADIRTIVCNMDKANETVFDDKNKALAVAEKLKKEYEKERKKWLESATRPQAYDENGNKIDYAVFDTDYVKRVPINEK
mgnify:CR=1 FL=1